MVYLIKSQNCFRLQFGNQKMVWAINESYLFDHIAPPGKKNTYDNYAPPFL